MLQRKSFSLAVLSIAMSSIMMLSSRCSTKRSASSSNAPGNNIKATSNSVVQATSTTSTGSDVSSPAPTETPEPTNTPAPTPEVTNAPSATPKAENTSNSTPKAASTPASTTKVSATSSPTSKPVSTPKATPKPTKSPAATVTTENYIAGTTWANLNNAGLAAIQSGWIYYRSSLHMGEIYKMRIDGSGKSLAVNYSAAGISFRDGSVFFRTAPAGNIFGLDNPDSIYSSDMVQKYPSLYREGLFVYPIGGKRYYFSSSVYIDGNGFLGSQKLFDGGYNYFEQSGWIYYMKQFTSGIYKTTLSGASTTTVTDESISTFNIYNNQIYFVSRDDNKLYRTNLDGSSKTLVLDDEVDSLNVSGGYIYYSNKSDGGKLYKINVNGSGKVKLYNEAASHINVIGDWIVYAADNNCVRIKKDGTGREVL